MRILHVIDKLDVGGAERVFVDLSNLLAQEKLDVTILCYLEEGALFSELIDNVKIIEFKRKSKYNILSAYKLASILKKYDIIHVHMRHNYRYIKLVSLIFNVKSKILLHDHSSNYKKVPFLLNSIFRPNYYIGVSNDSSKYANKKLGINKKNIYLLSNIVLKKIINTNTNTTKNMVLVGNIKPNKNQLFAISLLPYTKENLTIIGRVQDKEYFKQLKNKIKELNVENRVTFIHNENNVQKRIKNFKYALQVSKSESGPLVLIEFLAQKIPFLAYNTGEVSSIISKELPNYFLNSFKKETWIKKITDEFYLTKEKDELDKIYEKYFSPKQYVKKCMKIYQEISNC